jgi:cell division protein FtsQ
MKGRAMWDNPRQLNAAANLLLGLAALLFAYGGLQLLLRSPLFPLKEIVVRGALQNAAAPDIEAAVDGIGGNFFAVDLAAVRARLEQVGWVRRVDVRRVWPDRIEVKLEEHIAFARWGDTGLVNTFGEAFGASPDSASAARLPLFAGPAGTEGELTRRYRRFAELLAPLGAATEHARIAAIILTPRYAWQLRLADGLDLELGRDGAETVEQRLARFVAAYPDSIGRLPRQVAASGAELQRHVDLRYPNGFALRVAGWKG